LHSVCDAHAFHELVKNTKKIIKMKIEKVNNEAEEFEKRYNKIKELKKLLKVDSAERLPIYHIIFDGENQILKTIACETTDNSFVVEDEVHSFTVTGNGSVHFSTEFANVVGVLKGQVELLTLESAPLCISQDSVFMRIRYVVPYAKMEDVNP
jgi:hypothetical protein